MDVIRTLNKDELDESITLSCFAFQYEVTAEEREERKRRMDPDRIWGYFVDGKMAAKMHIHDMRAYVQGKQIRMGGVASVATWPEYRRKGMVAALLERGLQAMKEDGQTLSCLHPFAVSFYRKYGWELYADYKTYELTSAQLPREVHSEGRIVRADRDWQLLDRVYGRYAQQYNGTLVRDEAWWHHTVFKQKGGQAAVYFDDAGDPRGYVLYKVKNRVMDIGEMAFLDETARRGLWRFIANHDSMCDKIKLRAPADDDLPFLLPDPRIVQETVAYFSARIVDFKGFAEQYPFEAAGREETLYVRLADRTAPWNDGLFRVTVDAAGRATVREASEGEADGAESAACDIGTMAAMLLGYKRPRVMHRLGRLVGQETEAERWERLVPRRSSYLPDYF
ncbi:GNAT family N-acetyltransferase [Paenibacillus hemerocallicola]|jgi:predicted acetyltransferase|uniref:GNAT family N-acetyltransferase n=1 Tax=Paenibacillus hemerocallicola TaxID=1172614 RepID=A0A5C4SWL1_9BACL|nr:GNAT family N-acetyltransferase [Paenibacillus hemerocallicola]TNJ59287.1 GNAT family N-acetyltransferase [Paenibacillus hemerocallicola]